MSIFKNKADSSIIKNISWHPERQNQLCTVSQVGRVLIYDIEEDKNEQEPNLQYDGSHEIVNCAWGSAMS